MLAYDLSVLAVASITGKECCCIGGALFALLSIVRADAGAKHDDVVTAGVGELTCDLLSVDVGK